MGLYASRALSVSDVRGETPTVIIVKLLACATFVCDSGSHASMHSLRSLSFHSRLPYFSAGGKSECLRLMSVHG